MSDFHMHSQQKLLMYGDFDKSLWTSGRYFNLLDINHLSAKGSTPIDDLAKRVISVTPQRTQRRERFISLVLYDGR